MNNDRLIQLYTYFGYQGGTIHQMSDKTGVPVDVLLHGKAINQSLDSTYSQGWFAARTCGESHRMDLARNFHGNADFWLGVAAT